MNKAFVSILALTLLSSSAFANSVLTCRARHGETPVEVIVFRDSYNNPIFAGVHEKGVIKNLQVLWETGSHYTTEPSQRMSADYEMDPMDQATLKLVKTCQVLNCEARLFNSLGE